MTHSAIMWFENNFMKLNQDKCHFFISGNINEHLFAQVGDELIWESAEEKSKFEFTFCQYHSKK